ncbi:spermatogenesis-associated protein 21 [Ictidomys tridecemlineatus]
MDYRNTQMYMEDRTKAPGDQPSPGLSSTGKRTDAEPIESGASQVVFPEAAVAGGGKQPPFALGGPEKAPGHAGAAEEWPSEELGTHEQRLPASSGKKPLSWTAQEGPGELQAGHDQAKPEMDPGWPPSRLPVTSEGQPGVGTEHQQERPQTPSPVEDTPQDLECPSPGHPAADGSDTVQPTESSCPMDSCGQPLGDDAPKKAGVPHIRPREAAPEPSAGDLEGDSQEAVLLVPLTPAEEDTASPLLPSAPGPKTPKEGGEAVETQPAPGPLLPPVSGAGVGRETWCVCWGSRGGGGQRQTWDGLGVHLGGREQEPRGAVRCARGVPSDLTPALARPMAPGSSPAPMGALAPATGPCPVLPVPTMDLGWRRPELLPQSNDRSLSYTKARQELEERNLLKLYQSCEEWSEEHLTQKQEEAFRSYFEIFNGPGEVDAQSLKNMLLLVGFSLTPAQVEDVLMSADVDGDGHVDFKDFLAVMTDSKRFFCSVEQNALANMAPPNPHTLLFEILSLLVEMLALPEAALEEITNYYQKKLKDGTCKAREMDSAIGRLRSRKKLPYNPQQADSFEISERKVLRILSRIKQQNYAANLQSPYAQVPCIPLCPRMDKKMVRRKQGNHYVLDQCASSSLSPDIRSLFFPSGPQGSREHSSDSGKWLGSLPARTH